MECHTSIYLLSSKTFVRLRGGCLETSSTGAVPPVPAGGLRTGRFCVPRDRCPSRSPCCCASCWERGKMGACWPHVLLSLEWSNALVCSAWDVSFGLLLSQTLRYYMETVLGSIQSALRNSPRENHNYWDIWSAASYCLKGILYLVIYFEIMILNPVGCLPDFVRV